MEMLRHIGIGVAMGNASEEVKAAPDFVSGHSESDGLADFIERYPLIKRNICDLVFF
ncbi:HAD hydrolase family protein [Rossellomorea sp. GAMAL-10_SWC]